MYETASRGSRDTRDAIRARPPESPLDDWLGEVSDDDWSEEATARAQHRSAAPPYGERPAAATAQRPTRGSRPPGADVQAVVRRRRLVAGLVVALALAVAVVASLLLLRGGDKAPAPTVAVPTTSTPGPDETRSPAPTTPTTSTPASTTPSTTTPSTGSTSAFTLPDGTKLELGGENDAALVRELQQALTKAGYNPGAADGTFGKQTEQAVVAFQQDNGLAVDGRVGPETAAALANALASG